MRRLKLRAGRASGVTAVYVSHALDTIVAVCDHVAWIDHGRLRGYGTPREVTDAYLASVDSTSS